MRWFYTVLATVLELELEQTVFRLQTDPSASVGFLLPWTLCKGNESFDRLGASCSSSRVKGTSFWPSRTVPSWKVTEVPTTGRHQCSRVLYPRNARIPVLRNEFISSRTVLGTEQQVHNGPVGYGYFSWVYLRPWFARFP